MSESELQGFANAVWTANKKVIHETLQAWDAAGKTKELLRKRLVKVGQRCVVQGVLYNPVYNATALDAACSLGYTDTVNLLIQKGALTGNTSASCLTHAVTNSHTAVVNVLLSNGVDYTFKDTFGNNFLHVAVSVDVCTPELVHTLARAGVRASEANMYGESPLHYFAMFGSNEKTLRALLEYTDINLDVGSGPCVLVAAETLNSHNLRLMLRYGADPTVKWGGLDTFSTVATIPGTNVKTPCTDTLSTWFKVYTVTKLRSFPHNAVSFTNQVLECTTRLNDDVFKELVSYLEY